MGRRNADGGEKTAGTAAVFGEVLKHSRDSVGITQAGLAERVPCDRSFVARVEAGSRVPDDKFTDTCDVVLRTGGILRKLWEKIDWYPEVEHPDWFKRRAAMDAQAVALREYQNQVMPGLLQTEDYARDLFAQVATGEELEEMVRARLSRQHRFLSTGGPLLIAVLDESCIRNAVFSDAVMRNQCAHLLRVGKLPNIRVQVVPASSRGVVRPSTSMSLITMPDGQLWVYSESLDRGHFSDDPEVTARHAQSYDVLRADALSASESAALIRDAMEGYGHHEEPRCDGGGVGGGGVGQEQLQQQQRRKLRGNRPRYPRLRSPS
ncbi:Scr1 family TA system antitoxin-like transcriptional regulator [Streptomyces sp. NPDC059255]|uniref:helix-turn-helix domain-containing protein n=1 Tax=Streptomyces sp. NPDC059255 TaxID=3346793 RepID=UPI0036C3516A